MKIGKMACVIWIRPVTLVENIISMSEGEMAGAWATPLTRPLKHYISMSPSQNPGAMEDRREGIRIVHKHIDILELLR